MRGALRALRTAATTAARAAPHTAAAPPPPPPPDPAAAAASRSRSRLRGAGYLSAASAGVAVGAVFASTARRGGEGPPPASASASPPPRSLPGPASALEPPSLPARLLLSVARAASDAVGGRGRGGEIETGHLRCLRADGAAAAAAAAAPQTVLVACGSFNPPTVAHMRMFDVAEAALRERGHQVLGGYLSPVADGYGKPGLAPAADRVALCAAAAADAAAGGAPLAVDGWEAASTDGPVRSLVVLRSVEARLKAALGGGGGAKKPGGGDASPLPPSPRAMLLCGEDLLASMAAPGVWAEGHVGEIMKRHGVVCVRRRPPSPSSSPSSPPAAPDLLAPGGALAEYAGAVVVVEDAAGMDSVSSTLVRREAAAGRPLRWLTPARVEAEVRQRGLYGVGRKK